jgi:CRP-like cAMP-binding protein/CheY-like chemotaxis protein
MEAGGTCVVYATDHEPFWYQPSRATPGERLLHPGDRRHIEWLAGADLLIHDAQYTDAEYPAKRNWGHSTVEFVTDMAIMAGVKRLVLFHHDPTRTDQMVSRFVQRMLRRARKQGSNLDIIAAAEGLVIELPETTMTLPPTPAGTRLVITAGCTVMLAGGDEEELAEVQRALEPDGYHFITAGPINCLGEEMVRGSPDLLVLALGLEEGSTIELAHRLRADNPLGTIPIIILAREAGPDAARLLSLGIDIVLHPWSAPMLRARLRAWLTQSGLPQPEPTVRPNPRLLSTGQQMPTLFRGLPARARALFLDSARPVHLPPGEVLVHQNQAASGVYLIRSGTVAISISGADGHQIHLGTAGPGEAIGELAAISGGHHSATVVAKSQIVADYLPQDAFLAILVESPEAMLRLLRSLTMRLRASDMRVVELAFPEFYNRVVQLLLEGSHNTPGPTGLTADSLARRMRADAEQVRSAVALLEAQGLVHTGRQGFEVLDPLGLRKLIGLDDAAGQESWEDRPTEEG